ncbi:uncharacterized protein LOC111704903 [Eurytemora carolleeae]|uniref:uncharacterized protein LOC111704903 n=1 Tax=Eurytemora carolleeae TaxID=1294199 RepID=UPI000C763DF1|nr:uncharacterized protein LOC111704903 [Eurytemora carolleeae]|eukprot:XP_023333059.1 uncharacterized protein LOC111704903 [Eurytemora affinis]
MKWCRLAILIYPSLLYMMHCIESKPIATYFLNKHYDLRTSFCFFCNDHECVKTVNGVYPFSKTMTVCMRSFPMIYENPVQKWSITVSFGTLNEDEKDFEVPN